MALELNSPFLLLSHLRPITPNAANDIDYFPASDRVDFYFPTSDLSLYSGIDTVVVNPEAAKHKYDSLVWCF